MEVFILDDVISPATKEMDEQGGVRDGQTLRVLQHSQVKGQGTGVRVKGQGTRVRVKGQGLGSGTRVSGKLG